jgi:transposase
MMGHRDPQRTLFYQLSLETFVPPEHPLRAIRPLIEDAAIRRACRDLYAPIGRPSIPPSNCSWPWWAATCSASRASGNW